MKCSLIIVLLNIAAICGVHAQSYSLLDEIAEQYCKELSRIDTATRENFEVILTHLDEKIIFRKGGYLSAIVDEVNHSNVTYESFYTGIYSKFSKECPSYKMLYGMDTSIHLKDSDYFINSFCNCFTEKTEGKIENDDLTGVLKACNDKLGNDKVYKKKFRQELKNGKMTSKEFSKYITARFLTECDLIVNHLFNKQVKFLDRSTELMLEEVEQE